MTDQELFTSASSGDVQAVARLLDGGMRPDARSEKGATPLLVAAEKGHLDIVKFLVERGADPNLMDNYDDVPINRAAVCGHLDVVRFLAENGALYHSPSIGLHPIASAAANGHLPVVRYLVEEKKVPVNEMTMHGDPPLHGAAANGHAEVVRYLVDHGATPSQKGSLGQTAFATVERCMKLDGISQAEMQGYRHVLEILGRRNATAARLGRPRKERWRQSKHRKVHTCVAEYCARCGKDHCRCAPCTTSGRAVQWIATRPSAVLVSCRRAVQWIATRLAMSQASFPRGSFRREKTLGEVRGTPEWEDEVIKCEACGHSIGSRRSVRELAEARGWNSTQALGLRMPCPSCGRQLWVIL